MELSEDRGIECQGVCFNFVDGKIVLSVYQNLPGIKRDLAGTTFLRSFTIDDWLAVNKYLRDAAGDIEEDEEEEVSVIHSERRDLSVPTGGEIVEEKEEEEEVVQFRPIGVPNMTKDEGNDG